MKLHVVLDIPAELEGALTHARAALQVSDAILAQEAVLYALRRVTDGAPLADTFSASLTEDQAVGRGLRERIAQAAVLTEKALADNEAIRAAAKAIFAGPLASRNPLHGKQKS